MFYGLAGLTCLSAGAIVLTQNIVRMAVYLLLTLAGVAGLYFMLSAELLAAIQLIVYAGGTLILIVFGVMLTNRNPFMQLRAKPWELALAALIALVTMALLVLALVNSPLTAQAGLVPAVSTGYDSGVAMVGRLLLTRYLVPFEVAAVLLLVVMIGAAFMARKRSG